MFRKTVHDQYEGDMSYLGPLPPAKEGIVAGIAGLGLAAAMCGIELASDIAHKTVKFGKEIIQKSQSN